MIEVKLIKDSISEFGDRLITVQTKAPKFLDAEIEKHRMISTNSSSDRAIPAKKMAEKNVFIPDDIRKNEPGMQGYERLTESEVEQYRTGLYALIAKIRQFNILWSNKVHKQTLNRNLLGWSIQDKVMTATFDQWEYFLSLRDSEDADPSIQILAKRIKEEIFNNIPVKLKPNEWHLPYLSKQDYLENDIEINKKCSVARCARVSYLNHDKSEPNVTKDLELYDMLAKSKHWSCFEHIATPMEIVIAREVADLYQEGMSHISREGNIYSGNFKGWIQLRKIVDA